MTYSNLYVNTKTTYKTYLNKTLTSFKSLLIMNLKALFWFLIFSLTNFLNFYYLLTYLLEELAP